MQPYRFIPTCVGNTEIIPEKQYIPPVHPHVRGEYIKQLERENTQLGSSPRAWGILRHKPIF